MSNKDLEYEKVFENLKDVENSCGIILNEIHTLVMKPKINKIDPIISIASCLTLVIKNLEKNLNEQNFEVSFDEILYEIKNIDSKFYALINQMKKD